MPVPLRSDFDAAGLRRIARRSKDGPQARRLLALAAIYEGASRSDAARIGGVTLQIVRDWVVKFNAHGPEGLIDRKPPGRPAKLTDTHRATLAGLLDGGPIPAIHGVVRWRLIDLAQWLFDEFRISISKQTLSRELRAIGPAAPPCPERARRRRFSKDFPARLAALAQEVGGKPIEIWFADEARVGQKNQITRRWAKRGTRPSAPKDQRTQSASIFGAICPARGKGAGLVLPRCTIAAMAAQLEEISQAVAPGAHAVLLLDQAGWHVSPKLPVPGNITLVPLPPRSPELNPVENVWQFLRDNWLSNRVFASYEDILDHCCAAWNKLTDQPWRIMSIGLRDWAHGF